MNNIPIYHSDSVTIHHDLLSIPVKVCTSAYDFEGGLVDIKTGSLVEQGIIVRHRKLQQILTAQTEIPASIPEVRETIFYGGLLFDNFGHFLLESLSRLWAYKFYAKERLPILFYCPWGMPDYKNRRNYVHQVLTGFGIPIKRLIFFDKPVKLKSVIIPEQRYGFGTCQHPGEDFLKFIASFQFKQRLSIADKRFSKIYVSRAALPYKMGRPLGEAYFEKYLEQQGYLVFYPEKHTVYEQLSLYRHAEQIVFCDGGAIYCTVLTPDIKAEIAIIARRRDHRWNYKAVTEHFYGYKKEILWIDEVICQYQFGLETWDAVAEVDWLKVSIELKKSGFTVNHFANRDEKEVDKEKRRELQQYIQSIQSNPLFIDFMLSHKKEYPILPNRF